MVQHYAHKLAIASADLVEEAVVPEAVNPSGKISMLPAPVAAAPSKRRPLIEEISPPETQPVSEQMLDACVLCNGTCPQTERLVADCCVAMFHRQCLKDGFSAKYSAPGVTEVECLYCSTPHSMEWAKRLVFG